MFGKAKIRLLSQAYRHALEQRDEAKEELRKVVEGAAIVARHRDEAEVAAKRTADRNRHLTEQLELAREAQGDDDYAALEARLDRALRACARYRAALADGGGPSVVGGVIEFSPDIEWSLSRRLELSERARASLDTQLRQVQRVNEQLDWRGPGVAS